MAAPPRHRLGGIYSNFKAPAVLLALSALVVVNVLVPANATETSGTAHALVAAYPDYLSRIVDGTLIWKDGTRMQIDDGKGVKTLRQMLADPDINDMFAQTYVSGMMRNPPGFDHDPGRVRFAPLFAKMYGDCRKNGVRRNLIKVDWLPKHSGGQVLFSNVNGAAAQLQKVSKRLDTLPAAMIAFLQPSAGTFNCRVIAGTRRLSMHAYGVAIDINIKHSDYWRWSKPDARGRYVWRNKIPMEIVRIFEQHGFIWGGKWYHYDTMHFEYRPELLVPRQ